MFRIIDLFRKFRSVKELSSEPDLNNPEGLQVVSTHDEDDGDGEASVDIVAVHGLGGHPYDTWTHDNGIMWLRDLLPQDIPNARVMTWAYDSEPQTAKHFIHMMTVLHPDNLLSALYSLRKDTKSNNRPIIFMCHDLGGIVVKEALMRASMAIPQNKKHLKSIQICTKGVIFFGTPQQSTQQFSFGKTIRRLASVALSRESLLGSLETASNRLELQLEQFKSLCTGLTNYYCYERWPTRTPLGTNLMMSKASAIDRLCTGDSHCVGLDKDHMNMVKYPDKDCLDLSHPEANFKVPAVHDYHRNKSFTGRKEALAHLHSCVSNSHGTNENSAVVVIQGIAGVGKTQLAREYVYRYESSFDSVWWIDAQSLQSAYTGYLQMAQRLAEYYAANPQLWAASIADISRSLKVESLTDAWGEVRMDMKTPTLIVEAVKEWLCCKKNDHWLLVLDNVDSLESFNIADFIPETRSGNIIMTSRCKDVYRFGQEISLDVMGESESMSLLFKSCQRNSLSSDVADHAQASAIVAALGHLPSAIVQAGAYISKLDISLVSFLQAIGKVPLQDETMLHSRLVGSNVVYTTWEINFQIIKERSPRAADLLLLCSFLSPKNIPEEILSRGLKLNRQGESSLENELFVLHQHSLIMPSERIDSFDVHHMVHTWARDRQTPGERHANVAKVLVAIAITADAVREPEWRRRVFERQILPHIRQCLDYLAPVSVSSVGYRYWSVLGSVCKHQDEYDDAERLYKYAKEDLDGKPALEYEKALVLLQIASTSIARGKSAEAEEMSRHVLDRTVEGDLRLLSRIRLASVCEFQSRFHEAEQYLKDALYQCEDIFGPGNLRTLRLVDQLAAMYQKHGKYEKAEWLLRREVLSFEAHVSLDRPERSMAECKLASVCVLQGKYEEGEALLERLLDTHERLLGSEHPKTLRLVANLAAIYDLQGSFAESHFLYIRAQEGSQRTLGPKHIATLDILENMALRCYMQRQYEETEGMLRNVLEARLSQRHDVEAIERVKARLAELHKQQGSEQDSEQDVRRNQQRPFRSRLL